MNKKYLTLTLTILAAAAFFLAACGSAAPATPVSNPVTAPTLAPVNVLEPQTPRR